MTIIPWAADVDLIHVVCRVGTLTSDSAADPGRDPSVTLYRAQFQPHENGTHFRVWYSSNGPSSWRIGYTQVPRSLWP